MLRIHDIMSTDVVTLSPEASLRDAMDVLTTHHITGAPVVTGRKVVGVVSLTDLAEFAASSPGVPANGRTPAIRRISTRRRARTSSSSTTMRARMSSSGSTRRKRPSGIRSRTTPSARR
jgi:CBS domain-containing membrane protein